MLFSFNQTQLTSDSPASSSLETCGSLCSRILFPPLSLHWPILFTLDLCAALMTKTCHHPQPLPTPSIPFPFATYVLGGGLSQLEGD